MNKPKEIIETNVKFTVPEKQVRGNHKINDPKLINVIEEEVKAQKMEAKPTNQEETEIKKGPKKKAFFGSIYEFDFNIKKDNAKPLLSWIAVIAFWGLTYIWVQHTTERVLITNGKLKKEMKDLKADFYTSNAELSHKSIQSEVVKLVEPLGLKELNKPPYHIQDRIVNQEIKHIADK